MCVKFSKFAFVCVVLFLVSTQLFAWAIRPSVKTLPTTEVTSQEVQETVNTEKEPAIEPTSEEQTDFAILNELSTKKKLTEDQAVAIATVRMALDEMKEVNDSLIDENEALCEKIDSFQSLKLGLGLGVTYDPDKDLELNKQFGAQLLGSVRAGKNQFIVGVEYPMVADIVKEFDGKTVRTSLSYIREF